MAPGRRSCRCAKRWPAKRWQRLRAGGHNGMQLSSGNILSRFDRLCTHSARCAHDLAQLAAVAGIPATKADAAESSELACIALHVERITCELHAIGQLLPAALMFACMAGEAGEP